MTLLTLKDRWYYAATALYSVFLHPLARFPGPTSWAVSRLPWARHVINGDLWKKLDQLHQQYGPIVRIGPDEITTILPSAWRDIYTARPQLPKDPYSQTPPLNGAHSLFTAAGDTHKRIRGILVQGFSDKALRSQAPIIEDYASQLMTRLRREVDTSSDGRVDIGKFYGYATFDTVTDLSFGESFHGLEGSNEHSWIRGFFLHAKFGTVRNVLSRFPPLDKIIGFFFLRMTRANRLRNWRTCTARIDLRLSKKGKTSMRSDFLTPVLDKVGADDEQGISHKEVTTNALAVVIANCQLTTVALSAATYLLLTRPTTLATLAEEVRNSFSQDKDITVQATQGLPYLDAVINEVLRIHHPTPISLPRVVPANGHSIGGTFIPGNSIIGVNLKNIQNAPHSWVEPRVFHPERFLPPEDARYDVKFDGDVKAAFLPFSTGPRNCLGSKVFFAQARVILAKLIWNFELAMADPDELDWLDQKAYLVFEPKPLHLKLTDRKLERP
ncbi:MAG: hypothetical protein Q9166_006707 [cf. Caloplaca sp. 2 TL-2023]